LVDPAPAELRAILTESRAEGFLGPGELEPQIEHALGFAAAAALVPEVALDLGAGGGLPGLVLAWRWPDTRLVLLDASARRTRFLTRAVERLGLHQQVSVVRGRAEERAHGPERGSFDVVTARGFGPPAVTAECGAGFLRPGGRLIVSEPPESGDLPSRWPSEPLEELGLRAQPTDDPRYRVLRRIGPFPADRPRRVGIPTKRPLF
jgi:16S rRNA (guanine527-N7)-methyltransferase